MILTGDAIQKAVTRGEIVISPFDCRCVGPNSYDFHLGSKCRTYDNAILDSAKDNPSTLVQIGSAGVLLRPNKVYLFDTEEIIGSTRFVPIIRARSSVARLGLFIHVTADLIDLGSINRLTLQLHAVMPLRVYPSMPIGQVTFWVCEGAITLYSGKYRGVESPAASLSYRDVFDRISEEGTDADL